MFYICYIDLYDKGYYELLEYFCKFYEEEIIMVFYEFDTAVGIVIDLPDEDEFYSEDEDSEDEDEFYSEDEEEFYSKDSDSEDEDSEDEEKFYSEDHRLNKIINYHSRNFKSDFWGQPGFRKLSDDEYYDLIGEIVDGPINEYQLPRVFIFFKNGAQTEDFVLNETFKRLIKISLHFTSSEESKIREWNINFREYCENDFKEYVNYCFTTYPEYDNDNVDLKKLYLLDQTLNGLHQILH